jgi:probable F420-dependent oxidoreductase
LGFASVWTTDHVIIPAEFASSYPYTPTSTMPMDGQQPVFEAFATLSFLAAATEHVLLGVGVCVLSYRHPLLLAKQVATVDQLSEGRFVLGVGNGWLREEFDALGVPFAGRGQLADEVLDFLPEALGGTQPVRFHRERLKVDAVFVRPGTFGNRQLPVWIGGSSPRVLERVARNGRTWFPHLYGLSPDLLRRGIGRIHELRGAVGGRPSVALALQPMRIVEYSERAVDPAWARSQLRLTPAEVQDLLAEYADLGVDHAMLTLSGSPAERIRAMELLAEPGLAPSSPAGATPAGA